MALKIDRFWQDKRGTSFEGIALSVSIIAVAFVASADMLDYMTKSGDKIEVVAAHHAAPAKMGDDLDRAPTASLPVMITRSVLDPCTGEVK